MNLGSILLSEDGGKPLVGKPVEFWVKKGNAKRYRVKGVMFPLGEADRKLSQRDAMKYLRSLPEYQEEERDGVKYLPPIPARVQSEEEEYKRLCYILHDPENSAAKLVLNADYSAFRSGVIVEQINWLGRVYDKYIEDEYPEIVSDRDRKDLESEAAKNS